MHWTCCSCHTQHHLVLGIMAALAFAIASCAYVELAIIADAAVYALNQYGRRIGSRNNGAYARDKHARISGHKHRRNNPSSLWRSGPPSVITFAIQLSSGHADTEHKQRQRVSCWDLTSCTLLVARMAKIEVVIFTEAAVYAAISSECQLAGEGLR